MRVSQFSSSPPHPEHFRRPHAGVHNLDRSQSFTYDSFNRIAFAWGSGALWGERFEIDPWGNLNKIRACQSGDPCAGKPQGENLDQLANEKN